MEVEEVGGDATRAEKEGEADDGAEAAGSIAAETLRLIAATETDEDEELVGIATLARIERGELLLLAEGGEAVAGGESCRLNRKGLTRAAEAISSARWRRNSLSFSCKRFQTARISSRWSWSWTSRSKRASVMANVLLRGFVVDT